MDEELASFREGQQRIFVNLQFEGGWLEGRMAINIGAEGGPAWKPQLRGTRTMRHENSGCTWKSRVPSPPAALSDASSRALINRFSCALGSSASASDMLVCDEFRFSCRRGRGGRL